MTYFDVEIKYLSGQVEVVRWVNRVSVRDDVLHLHGHREGSMGDDHHLGSYPLANISKWTRRDH